MAFQKRSLSQEELAQEHQLVQAAQNNPRRFSALYERYYEQMFYFIYKRVDREDICADICSEVFLKAMKNLKKYQFRGVPFSAWLYRIAINEVNQFFRTNKQQRSISLETTQIGEMMDEAEAPRDESGMQQMIQALPQLKDEDLQMVELRFFEQLPFRQIAEIYGITENNAKVRMYRILGKLRKLMDPSRVNA
ncbi:MAG: sigma-70 family RNA polymerase sigma factor [Bacteroidota bacterium]